MVSVAVVVAVIQAVAVVRGESVAVMHVASIVVVLHKTTLTKRFADTLVAVLLVDRLDLSHKPYVLNSDDLCNLRTAMVTHLVLCPKQPRRF